jgi:hypothetical protein
MIFEAATIHLFNKEYCPAGIEYIRSLILRIDLQRLQQL